MRARARGHTHTHTYRGAEGDIFKYFFVSFIFMYKFTC